MALGLEHLDQVAHRDRAVELAGVRRLSDQRQRDAVDRLRILLGLAAARGVVRHDPLAIGFEYLAIGFVGTKRFLVGKEKVAGEPVLHLHHIADAAELLDAFQQDHIHLLVPYLTM